MLGDADVECESDGVGDGEEEGVLEADAIIEAEADDDLDCTREGRIGDLVAIRSASCL